jgi:hypothetical protein
MDILFWINNNPQVDLQDTKKIFFKEYLCKMQIFCPAGRLIHGEDDITVGLEFRRQFQKNHNYGGSWSMRSNSMLDSASIEQLEMVRSMLQEKKIKVRVEEPYVQFYSHTEDELKSVLNTFPEHLRNRLHTIIVPKNEAEKQLLLENKILRKSRRDNYRYKVTFKDGRMNVNTKLQLLNYLKSLGEEIKLPLAAERMLQNGYSGFWGVYCYTNDTSITTFINLICPGTISNVHEIVTVE